MVVGFMNADRYPQEQTSTVRDSCKASVTEVIVWDGIWCPPNRCPLQADPALVVPAIDNDDEEEFDI